MTQFIWDASAWDWGRGQMDLSRAQTEGIEGFSHRGTTGTIYKDPYLGQGIDRALNGNIKVLGSYMVVRTPGNGDNGTIDEQVEFFLTYLDSQVSWWRTWPYWFFQVDTEKWTKNNVVVDDVDIRFGVKACESLEKTNKRVIHYAPKWRYGDSIPGTQPLWASHYIKASGNFAEIYPGDDFDGWRPYSNRTPIFLQFSDNATITKQKPSDANAFRGTLDELKTFIRGEGPTVTYAPDDLKAIQRYLRDKTNQDWASLGIIHSTPQGGGYHEGVDLFRAVGTAPEQPGGDYSYTESQRDRAGLTEAASAVDIGGNFDRFREITLAIVRACENGDPRTRDIREVIYTPDGKTVRRFDRVGKRSTGDSSHLTHTHVSFFRDSDGRRDQLDNFLGLLIELFEGKKPPSSKIVEDDEMIGMLPQGFAYDENGNLIDITKTVMIPFEDVNGGTFGRIVASFNSDHMAQGKEYHLRLVSGKNDGTPTIYQNGKLVVKAASTKFGGGRAYQYLDDGHTWACLGRRKSSATPPAEEATWPVGWSLARYPK